jgi:hypothetical protein
MLALIEELDRSRENVKVNSYRSLRNVSDHMTTPSLILLSSVVSADSLLGSIIIGLDWIGMDWNGISSTRIKLNERPSKTVFQVLKQFS